MPSTESSVISPALDVQPPTAPAPVRSISETKAKQPIEILPGARAAGHGIGEPRLQPGHPEERSASSRQCRLTPGRALRGSAGGVAAQRHHTP